MKLSQLLPTSLLALCLITEAATLTPEVDKPGAPKPIFGISFRGLNKTEEQVVERELIHKPSTHFNRSDWLVEKKRLESLDIFSSIHLDVEPKADSLNLVYLFEELPPAIPFIGGKKTDQDGLILGPALVWLNFLGRDIRLELYARTTIPDIGDANEYRAVVSSYWLANLPVEFWMECTFSNSFNPFLDYPERSQFYLIEFKQRLRNNWAVRYKSEFFTVSTEPEYREKMIMGPSGLRDRVPRFGLGILKDTRESRFNPHRGYYGELLYTHSGKPLAIDVNYGEILGDVRAYFPMGSKHILHFSLLAQYRLGAVGNYDRFYIGGANTLRGYHPIDDGFLGDSEVLSFIEYRYEMIPKKNFKILGLAWYYGIQLITGFDVAYAWDRNAVSEGTDGRSLYTGIHILFPGLDRFRFELGNKAVRLKLDMGFSFGMWERSTAQRWRVR